MPRVRRPMLAISIAFTISAAAMWSVAVGLTIARRDMIPMSLDRAAAVAMTILAGLCWLERRREGREEDGRRMKAKYERREEALMRTISSLADEPTEPLRLHSVS